MRQRSDVVIPSKNIARPLTHYFLFPRALLGIVSTRSAEGTKSVCLESVIVIDLAAAMIVEELEVREGLGDVGETSRMITGWTMTGVEERPGHEMFHTMASFGPINANR